MTRDAIPQVSHVPLMKKNVLRDDQTQMYCIFADRLLFHYVCFLNCLHLSKHTELAMTRILSSCKYSKILARMFFLFLKVNIYHIIEKSYNKQLFRRLK